MVIMGFCFMSRTVFIVPMASLLCCLLLLQACATDDSRSCELQFDGRTRTPDAIVKGFAAAGLRAKAASPGKADGRFESNGVSVSYSRQADGKVNVLLKADGDESAKLIPAISNGIGRSVVPWDKLRKHPGKQSQPPPSAP